MRAIVDQRFDPLAHLIERPRRNPDFLRTALGDWEDLVIGVRFSAASAKRRSGPVKPSAAHKLSSGTLNAMTIQVSATGPNSVGGDIAANCAAGVIGRRPSRSRCAARYAESAAGRCHPVALDGLVQAAGPVELRIKSGQAAPR